MPRLIDGTEVSSYSEEWRLDCYQRWLDRPREKPQQTEGERIGLARQGIRKGKGTERFFANDAEEDIIGASGEVAFARLFGLQVDETLRPGGDNGIDFTVKLDGKKTTIDVKTARKPAYMLVKKTHIRKCADILVLARYCPDKSISFLGWATKNAMAQCPMKDFGYRIVSHYMPASNLQPMSELKRLLGKP